MIKFLKIKNNDKKNNNIILKIFILAFIIYISFFNKYKYLIQITGANQKSKIEDKLEELKKTNEDPVNRIISQKINNYDKNCYIFLGNSNKRIIHLIITRFLIIFYGKWGFPKKLYKEDYIPNGIRVMKKYLFPSLENQSCKDFTWILLLGNKANITYVKLLLNFNISFKWRIIYQKDIKNYVRNISKGFDVLITTRIDYDDVIYYDAVNDIRKAININKPMLLYGYNRGIMYFESEGKSCDFDFTGKNDGVWSIFVSLITVLDKVNDTYIIYDLGDHSSIRKTFFEKYKSYGIKELNYEPTIFDNGDIKFAWVRQKYSGSYDKNGHIKKELNVSDFNLNKFYKK